MARRKIQRLFFSLPHYGCSHPRIHSEDVITTKHVSSNYTFKELGNDYQLGPSEMDLGQNYIYYLASMYNHYKSGNKILYLRRALPNQQTLTQSCIPCFSKNQLMNTVPALVGTCWLDSEVPLGYSAFPSSSGPACLHHGYIVT